MFAAYTDSFWHGSCRRMAGLALCLPKTDRTSAIAAVVACFCCLLLLLQASLFSYYSHQPVLFKHKMSAIKSIVVIMVVLAVAGACGRQAGVCQRHNSETSCSTAVVLAAASTSMQAPACAQVVHLQPNWTLTDKLHHRLFLTVFATPLYQTQTHPSPFNTQHLLPRPPAC